MSVLDQIFAGMRLELRSFGRATIVKLGYHTDTKELCVDVKADSGETLHLSQRYIERLMS